MARYRSSAPGVAGRPHCALHDLSRKHQVKAEELPAVLVHLETELADIEDFDVNLEKLDKEIKDARDGYLKLAKEVSRERTKAAAGLARSDPGNAEARHAGRALRGNTYATSQR